MARIPKPQPQTRRPPATATQTDGGDRTTRQGTEDYLKPIGISPQNSQLLICALEFEASTRQNVGRACRNWPAGFPRALRPRRHAAMFPVADKRIEQVGKVGLCHQSQRAPRKHPELPPTKKNRDKRRHEGFPLPNFIPPSSRTVTVCGSIAGSFVSRLRPPRLNATILGFAFVKWPRLGPWRVSRSYR